MKPLKYRRSRAPHCASAHHFQICMCSHERRSHEELDGAEIGPCLERALPPRRGKCSCPGFRLRVGQKEIAHLDLNIADAALADALDARRRGVRA
jgi:hypothetical protein